MLLLVFLLVSFIGINAKVIHPIPNSIRTFRTYEQFDRDIQGQLASAHYEVTPIRDAVADFDYHGKIWIAIHKIDHRYRVTVVRLDNLMDRFDRDLEYELYEYDKMWRDLTGWNMELKVNFKSHNYELIIPANPHEDALQFDLEDVYFPLAENRNFRYPKVIYQVPGNFKDVNYPIIEKLMALTRIMAPGWTHAKITEDLIAGKLAAWDSSSRLLKIYQSLAPVAYRIDFFRYIVMYLFGGVYLDSKMVPTMPLDELLPVDKNLINPDLGQGFSNAMLAFEKGSAFMREAIKLTSRNVLSKSYGQNSLDITGPLMLHRMYTTRLTDQDKSTLALIHHASPWFRYVLDAQNRVIVNVHNGEYRRRFNVRKGCNYAQMWERRVVYYEEPTFLFDVLMTDEDGDLDVFL